VQLRWIRDNSTDEDRPLRIVVARRVVSGKTTSGRSPSSCDSRIAAPLPSPLLRRPFASSRSGRNSRWSICPRCVNTNWASCWAGRSPTRIGHYLLQSNAHSPYGLMRASIDAREFADLRTGAFRLDRESQAYLAARALACTQRIGLISFVLHFLNFFPS
jgi:hypothetical protein